MKTFLKKINWLLLIGILAAVLFTFSNFFFGKYQMSYTNMMYLSQPWDSLEVSVEDPVMTDVIDSYIPSMYTTIGDGTVMDFWDSQAGLGAPVDGSSWLYPLNYLFLLPLSTATLLRAIAEFTLAFLGMYLFMKAMGCRKIVASIAGVSYCFCSVIVLWLGWQHSDVAAFAPLAFFFFERFLETVKFKYCFGLAASVYLMLVAGMPTYAAYFMYLLAAYVLFRTAWIYRSSLKRIFQIYGCTLASVALGVLGSMPYLVSLLNSVGSNGYAGSRTRLATWALDMDYLQTLFMPYLRINEEYHPNESTIYVGLVAAALVIFTAYNFRKKKRMIFWTAALAVVFILLFTHALDGIYTHLPLVNTSHKFRLVCLMDFVLVVMGGLNLNDIAVNREDYCRKKLKTCLFAAGSAALLGLGLLWTYSVYQNQGHGAEFRIYLLEAGIIIALLLAFLVRKIPGNLILSGLCLVAVLDMGSFAKNNLPMVEKEAGDLPPATDTITFLQENVGDARMTATGEWTLFPNTNIFYGLEDIRTHNFTLTNPDMENYYTLLDSEGFTSPTRFVLTENADRELLQYMGVKYIAHSLSGPEGAMTPVGPVFDGISAEQIAEFSEDSPEVMVIAVGTSGCQYQEEDRLRLRFTDPETGLVVYEKTFPMKDMQDNALYVMELGENNLEGGRAYQMELTVNTPADRSLSLYTVAASGEPGISVDGQKSGQTLWMFCYYNTVYAGEDGLIVEELEDYTDRVELADTVRTGDDRTILHEMAGKYEKHTVFLTEEESEKRMESSYGPLTESDTARIVSRTDDVVTVEVHTESAKILMLNEYYDKNWKVYVNGEEQELLKTNYLFRGLEVPAGDSLVEFRYEPQQIRAMYGVAGAAWGAAALLAAFRKKIQKKLEVGR